MKRWSKWGEVLRILQRNQQIEQAAKFGIPQQIVWKILLQKLLFKLHRLRFFQYLTPEYYLLWLEFCISMLEDIKDEDFAHKLMFRNEETF